MSGKNGAGNSRAGARPLRIGLPRAMLYYRYATLWATFFQELGMEILVSPATDKQILDQGTAISVDETCLSAKIYLGHVKALVGQCDYILVPRVSSFGHRRVMCTRFEAMPDVVANLFQDSGQKFISYNLDVLQKQEEKDAFLAMAEALGAAKRTAEHAYAAAKKQEQQRFKQALSDQEALLQAKKTKILIAAHSYVIQDPYLGRPVTDILKGLGAVPIRADLVNRSAALKRSAEFSPTLKWEMSREIVGGILEYKDKVDGIVLLSAFPCGPDSMVNELLMRRIQGIPMLNLTVDAQSGVAGVETRLESFVDIIHFKEGTL